jgi:hypothetical protein
MRTRAAGLMGSTLCEGRNDERRWEALEISFNVLAQVALACVSTCFFFLLIPVYLHSFLVLKKL